MNKKEKLTILTAILIRRRKLAKARMLILMNIQLLLNSLMQLCTMATANTQRLLAAARCVSLQLDKRQRKSDRTSQFRRRKTTGMSNGRFKRKIRKYSHNKQ